MAITSPEAVKFSNECVRTFADTLVTVYETALKFKAQFDAQALSALFPNNASEVVGDGAVTDGRSQMTGQKVQALYTAAVDMLAWGDTVVLTKTRITWLRSMHVNGMSRF